MDIAVLAKGSFRSLKGAKAVSMGLNAWEIEIPVTPETKKLTRRGGQAQDWDGAVFLMDDRESEPAVGSGESKNSVKVTVFFL